MYGDSGIALVNGVLDKGVKHVVLLMRHSAREYAEGVHDAKNPLTEEGRALSLRFGENLPPNLLVRAYHSPVGRCRETAERMLSGYASKGGQITRYRPVDGLGVFYVLDQMKMYRAMQADGGLLPFTQKWYAGGQDADILMPAQTAALALLDVLREKLEKEPEGLRLDLCVSHDLSLLTMLDQLLGQPSKKFGNVEYLDAIAVYYLEDQLVLHSRHGEVMING
jgi:broad specificity phosphatase PhoE